MWSSRLQRQDDLSGVFAHLVVLLDMLVVVMVLTHDHPTTYLLQPMRDI
jgi:hypothetical protein